MFEARLLVRAIKQRRCSSAQDAARLCEAYYAIKASRQTAARVLLRAGLKSRRKRKKPFLNKRHRKQRRAFAQRYRHWNLSDWMKVIWSDESKVQRLGIVTECTYWSVRPDYEQNTPTQQGGGHAVMIWGCMTWAGLGRLAFVQGRLYSQAYIELLEENLSGSLDKWKSENPQFDKKDMVFQQDNAPCHASRATKEYLKDTDINVLDWPANSPDLNPIEHVWALLKRQVGREKHHFRNTADLRAAVLKAWNNFPLESVQRLIESMPRRLEAVIAAKGGPTKY